MKKQKDDKEKVEPNLEDKIKELEKKSEENLNGWKRALADYQNLQKENQKEKDNFVKFANLNLLMELLPVISNFKMAMSLIPPEQKDNWVIGMAHILRQFDDFLKDAGVEEIETSGKMFDPKFHEAVDRQKSEEKKQGEIVKEISKGYLLKGEVIIPARVVVGE